jgi:hypothetical protein
MQITKTAILFIAMLGMTSVFAMDMSDDNMQALRDKVHADRKLIVSTNMGLSESEAKNFWPVYDEYIKELAEINKDIAELIKSYAADYNADSLTDEKAKKLIDKYFDIEKDELKLKESYAKKLDKILPAKKVALALQIENKIRTAVKVELAAQIPLVE